MFVIVIYIEYDDDADDDNARSCPNIGTGGAVEPAPPKKKARTRPQLTDDEEDLMLEFLRENSFLYDKKRKHYHDRDLRNRIWDDQASKMNRPRAILEVWYDSLRTRYGKLLKDSKKSGSGTKEHSDRDNWVITQLSFLQPFIADRRIPKPLVSIKEKIATSLSSAQGSAIVEADTHSQDDPRLSTNRVLTPESATEDITTVPAPDANNRKKSDQHAQLSNKLQQAEEQQNELFVLVKDFVQRTQAGDPVRRSYCEYITSVLLKLPNDMYRRITRQLQGLLDEALDEVDRREGHQQIF